MWINGPHGWRPLPVKTVEHIRAKPRDLHDPYIVDFSDLEDCKSFVHYCITESAVVRNGKNYRIVPVDRLTLHDKLNMVYRR